MVVSLHEKDLLGQTANKLDVTVGANHTIMFYIQLNTMPEMNRKGLWWYLPIVLTVCWLQSQPSRHEPQPFLERKQLWYTMKGSHCLLNIQRLLQTHICKNLFKRKNSWVKPERALNISLNSPLQYKTISNKSYHKISRSCLLYSNCLYMNKQLLTWAYLKQGIINMNRNRNFCKGTWVRKVIAETKVDARVDQENKFTGFSRISVMANLLCFGCIAAG